MMKRYIIKSSRWGEENFLRARRKPKQADKSKHYKNGNGIE